MGKQHNMDFSSEDQGLNSFTRPIAFAHNFYISGEVKSPEEYKGWFEEIRLAPENDLIYLHINSPGGDVFTAIQFLRVLFETKATVVASVEGMCMSAATMIFMAAQHHEITTHSMFMFHNFSTISAGKGGELYDHAVNAKSWSEGLLNDIYKEFLTKTEIDAILDGKDLYLTGEDVSERLKTRKIKFQDIQRKLDETEAFEIEAVGQKKKEEVAKKVVKKTVKRKSVVA